jgi:8-oxo-dGTP diphosphatase
VATDPLGLPIQTERFRLRLLADADAEWIERLAGNWNVARYTARIPHPYPKGGGVHFVAASLAMVESGSALPLVIERKTDCEPLGMIGLEINGLRREAEIGYWLAEPYWGDGVMTEAVCAMAAYALGRLALTRLHAGVLIGNAASMQVLRKAEFEEVGPTVTPTPARDIPEMAAVAFERRAPRPSLLVAAVALVDRDGRVLLAQRPEGKTMAGLWEFPGGKVDPGETPEAALIRELREELAVDTAESCLSPLTFASHAYEDFHLLMPLYVCRVWQGQPTPLEGQQLAWVRPNRMREYPMPPADRPLVAMLRDLL